jgi:hypothetical protein
MTIMESLAKFAVDKALNEAKTGVFENANDNRGTRIDLYASAANGVMGEAWCVKFVYWCYGQAAATLGVGNPMPRIFGAQALESWARRQNKLFDTPLAGDILIKQSRHGGLVIGPAIANGTFPSVEGNTWAGTTFKNRREGVYVLKSTRVSDCTFIRVA